METTHDISLYEGDSRTLDVTVEKDGGSWDLTNGSVEWAIVDSAQREVFSKSTDSDITITDPANGEIVVPISSSDTSDNAGYYTHYLRVTDADGNTAIVLSGSFQIDPSPV